MAALGLPIGQPLLVFFQHRGRDLLGERRIAKLLLHLLDLRVHLLEFLPQARLFRREIDQTLEKDQIRNSNSIMLKSLAENSGAVAAVFPTIGDDLSDLKSQISDAAAQADIVVTTGGVSVGKYDLTKLALSELGAEIFFDKVALKPGKPTVFAKLGKTFIFGLPGNPVSAAVTFHLFVRPMMMLMQNASESGLRSGHAVLGERARSTKDRDTYLPARLETDKTGKLIANPLKWHGSSDFIGFAKAEALIVVPKGETREKGEVANITFI